ncbi:MAG TPA: hypothetical protein DDY78_04195 [Planctomycetales bacterium]|jgi:hypothetical protein|nr:hypothetical protein [Planctomycetales bacterium]
MNSNTSDLGRPTPDDLGGIPVVADCPEVTTIRPRRPYIKVPAILPDPYAKPTPDDLSGIPIGFIDEEPPRRAPIPTKPDESLAG